MKIRLKSNVKAPAHLTHRLIYQVLCVEDDMFRLLDDGGEPSLFECHLFEIVDESIPSDWVTQILSCDEKYSGPPRFLKAGYFEDVFDDVEEAVEYFQRYLQEHQIRNEPSE